MVSLQFTPFRNVLKRWFSFVVLVVNLTIERDFSRKHQISRQYWGMTPYLMLTETENRDIVIKPFNCINIIQLLVVRKQ